MSPTWNNGKVGKAGIAKRLDRFLMAEELCSSIGCFRSWSVASGVSDHRPIVLQLELESAKTHFPFNFNHSWLNDSEFCGFVKDK